MACFLVPAAEAVAATAIKKVEEKKEPGMTENITEISEEVTIPWSRKLQWLTYMLWGGTILLAFEHILEDLTSYRNKYRRFLLTSCSFRFLSSKHQ